MLSTALRNSRTFPRPRVADQRDQHVSVDMLDVLAVDLGEVADKTIDQQLDVGPAARGVAANESSRL